MKTITLAIPPEFEAACVQRLAQYNRGLPPATPPRQLDGMLQDFLDEDLQKWKAAHDASRLAELSELGKRIIAAPPEVQEDILAGVRAKLPEEVPA